MGFIFCEMMLYGTVNCIQFLKKVVCFKISDMIGINVRKCGKISLNKRIVVFFVFKIVTGHQCPECIPYNFWLATSGQAIIND